MVESTNSGLANEKNIAYCDKRCEAPAATLSCSADDCATGDGFGSSETYSDDNERITKDSEKNPAERFAEWGVEMNAQMLDSVFKMPGTEPGLQPDSLSAIGDDKQKEEATCEGWGGQRPRAPSDQRHSLHSGSRAAGNGNRAITTHGGCSEPQDTTGAWRGSLAFPKHRPGTAFLSDAGVLPLSTARNARGDATATRRGCPIAGRATTFSGELFRMACSPAGVFLLAGGSVFDDHGQVVMPPMHYCFLDFQGPEAQEEKEARKKFFDRHKQLKAGLDNQRQEEIRADKAFSAQARSWLHCSSWVDMTLPAISEKWASAVDAVTVPQGEQRAGYEMPSDWTRARLDEIEAKRERQRAYLRMWSIKDFSSLRVLGKGAFGVVHLVQRQGTEEVYALKQIQKAHFLNKNHMKARRNAVGDCCFHCTAAATFCSPKAYNERDALSRGHGVWFVDLLCTFQDSEHIYIVMEFVQGGDFFAYMEKKDKLSITETRFYMAELICAIAAIHQCGFIHRDLKPDNLVLTSQGHLKLLDFGLCTPVDVEEYMMQVEYDSKYQGVNFQERPGREGLRTACGTPQYMAPEMFNGRACAASDLWALGVITFECLSGSLPFYTQSRDRRRAFQELRSQIQHHEANLPTRLARMQKKQRDLGATPQDCVKASQFVNKVLCPVERRITAFECQLDDFFEGLDFSRLQEMQPPHQPSCKSATDASNFDDFPAEKLPTPEDITCMDPDLDWPLYEDDAKASRARCRARRF
ncbi:STK38 [Symbiodinium natans]|uniref:non-specific serine/threonine protein kinase n=1 Tax=Symbiodinium natans TaxID=878477 RepID=A0A812TWT0_9DINO|nr:STK38 [Symbiodinium natans]